MSVIGIAIGLILVLGLTRLDENNDEDLDHKD